MLHGENWKSSPVFVAFFSISYLMEGFEWKKKYIGLLVSPGLLFCFSDFLPAVFLNAKHLKNIEGSVELNVDKLGSMDLDWTEVWRTSLTKSRGS